MYLYTPKVYRYTLAKNDKNPKCTGIGSKCTGTGLRKVPKMFIFSHFSCTFPSQTKSILHIHFKNTPNSSYNLFSTQIIFHHLSFFQTFPLISPNTILIWVMTHIQTKYQGLLGFVLNPNSISFHLTMNPTTKGGFHTYLVPCGFNQP